MKAQDVYKRITGTGKQAEIRATYRELIQVLGEPEPNYESGDGKVQCLWIVETPYGVGTVYDYKSDVAPEDNFAWSIGGKNKKTGEWILGILFNEDSQFKVEDIIDGYIISLYDACNDLGLELRHPTKCMVTDWLNDEKLRSKVRKIIKQRGGDRA